MTTIRSTLLLLPALVLLNSCKSDSSGSGTDTRGPIQITTSSGVPMIHLAGGNFTMGSDKESADEKPAHQVRISAFLIDAYEVTHEMFAKAELPNPSHWQEHPQMPVEQVRWRDSRRYCNERSLLEGLPPCYDESKPGWPCDFDASGYRLPTEAEWEFACRAGGSGRYGFGDTGKLKQYAWFDANSGERTHPAGSRKPNAWGIFDMYGNVSEWCEDIYAPDYYAKNSSDDPVGPVATGAMSDKRVMRGGNWKSSADMCRATFRKGQITGDSDACFNTDYCGFRCVRRVSPEELKALQVATSGTN